MEGLEGAAHVTSRPSPIAHQLYQAQQAMDTPVTAFPAFDVERQQLEQAASNACQACAACGQACHQARLWIVNTPKVENRPQYVRPKLSKNVARALFWYTAFLVPSARGANGFLDLFQPARVRAAASAPFLAASWRIRAAANGWLFASTAGYCFQATRFLSSEIFYEFIKFLCNRAINQMTCSSCEMAPYQSQQSVKHESFSI